MMVTDLRCCQHHVGDFFRYVGDFLNVLNRSPTSQTCHQHIWSPTSVTNIDVTPGTRTFRGLEESVKSATLIRRLVPTSSTGHLLFRDQLEIQLFGPFSLTLGDRPL